ncbi:MAG: NfeD family protein [Candidatus Dormibacteria bacterium]
MRREPIVGAGLVAAWCFLGSELPVLAASPGAAMVNQPRGWVGVLANPNVAFVLLLAALLGLGLEVVHPGTLVFGSVGLAAGVLAVVGLVNQPIDWLGLLLIGLAVVLFVTDTSLHSHGLIGLAAVACAIVGGLVLYQAAPGEPGVNLAAVIAVPAVVGGAWVTLSRRALRVRRLPYGSTNHELLGLSGVVRQRADPNGIAAVDGELWRIQSHYHEAIEVGTAVEVLAQDGLTLIVQPQPGVPAASEIPGDPGGAAMGTRRAS